MTDQGHNPRHEPREIQIKAGLDPRDLEITYGGTRIDKAVTEVRFTQRAGHFPMVHLDLAVHAAAVEGQIRAAITMPPEARDGLVALGWRPPETFSPNDALASGFLCAIGWWLEERVPETYRDELWHRLRLLAEQLGFQAGPDLRDTAWGAERRAAGPRSACGTEG